MARMGMDVDAVEQAGRRLQTQAGQLGDVVAGIDRLVAELPGVWEGRDAQRFVHEWWPQHRASLHRLREAVDGLGRAALANAAEQRHASGSDTGGGLHSAGGGGGVLPGAAERVAALVQQAMGADPGGGDALDVYLGVMDRAQAIDLPNGMNLWDVLSLAGKADGVPVLDKLADLQTFGGAYDSLREGHLSLGEVADVTATLLQQAPPLTPPHLVGDAVSAWTEVGRLAGEADFSASGLRTVADYVASDPWGAIQAGVEANIAYAPTLLNRAVSIFR